MFYCCIYVFCVWNARVFVFWGYLPEIFVLKAFYISAFAAIPFEICFAKTCKLKKEELCLYYARM
jgi:hypothetical protein